MDKPKIVNVIIISGRSGSGKTSIAYEIHEQLARNNIHHVQIEGDNLDMMYPEEREEADIFLANLSSMWHNYVRLRGCDTLVINGTAVVLGHEAIRSVLKKASLGLAGPDQEIVVKMRAFILGCSDDTAKERLIKREVGSKLQQHLDSSNRMAVVLDGIQGDWVQHLETDRRTVVDMAKIIVQASLAWFQGTHD